MRQAWLPAAPESAPRARAFVREVAAELRLDEETTWELTLATTEAFANAIEHGSPCPSGGIRVCLDTACEGVGVEIRDCGTSFTGTRTSKPPGEGGRGISLIQAVVDRLEVTPGEDGTRVRFEKRVGAAA
jgi:anti-sigma regulatory factor (Ser/Thr protein kinase)